MHALDLSVFHLVNGWSGNWALDRIVGFEEASNLFRGGLLLIPYWWFWFAGEGERRERRRRVVVAALLGTFAALILARGMATMLPFRLRPIHEIGIGFQPPSLPIVMNLENWSSFPSDTASLFFALSFGIWRLSRPIGAALMAYSAILICLPRIYLGIHYPSDIVAGALLGIAAAWATIAVMETRDGALGRRIMGPLSALEARRPGLFYAAAFAMAFEMATMFDDVRALGRAGVRWLRHAGIGPGAVLLLLAGAFLFALSALAWIAVHRRRRADRSLEAGGHRRLARHLGA